MVHPGVFPKHVVSSDVKCVVVKKVDIGNQFKIEQEFKFRDHMFQWIRMESFKMGFIVVIGRSDNGSDNRCAFVTKYDFSKTFSHRASPHLKIQMIILCVLDDFQNHDTLFNFI